MRILIEKTDGPGGTVSIMNVDAQHLADALDKWKQVNPGRYIAHTEIGESNIPEDRTYRDALVRNGNTVEPDFGRAREIQRERLRRLRAPLLTALDIAYQRADERDDKAEKARITERKQALRDVTADPALEAATTLDELKAVLPDVLKG